MTHLAIEHALLAVMAAGVGDTTTAADHIIRAQQQSRATARRARQVVEIAALVVAGDRARAAGLALEHATEFADDADLLVSLTQLPSDTSGTIEDARSKPRPRRSDGWT